METTDGRFIKILEIEPINFLLRSNEEQWGIISTFASWLKISPMRLQFKSVTRKADSDQYVAGLRADLEQETVSACRKLGEGTIRFIREEGSREALSRRFFLIFQFEAVSGRKQMGPDYGEIYATLQTVAQNARTYFAQCGNSIVQPKDEDSFLAEVLYAYFNRRSCVDDPFQNRLNRVVVDFMTAKKRVIGVDAVPHIQPTYFVAPRGLDLTHPGYLIMDGIYYTYLYIRKNGFPQQVRGGWMSSLINAGEGVDIDLHLRREIRGKTIDRVAQRIYQYDEVESLYLMSGGAYDMIVTISGRTLKEVAQFVGEKLAPIEGVTGTATHFILKKYKEKHLIFPVQEVQEERFVLE